MLHFNNQLAFYPARLNILVGLCCLINGVTFVYMRPELTFCHHFCQKIEIFMARLAHDKRGLSASQKGRGLLKKCCRGWYGGYIASSLSQDFPAFPQR